MIKLQIPEGDKCKGCMFWFEENQAIICSLFSMTLEAEYYYGELIEESVSKCHRCFRAGELAKGE